MNEQMINDCLGSLDKGEQQERPYFLFPEHTVNPSAQQTFIWELRVVPTGQNEPFPVSMVSATVYSVSTRKPGHTVLLYTTQSLEVAFRAQIFTFVKITPSQKCYHFVFLEVTRSIHIQENTCCYPGWEGVPVLSTLILQVTRSPLFKLSFLHGSAALCSKEGTLG